MISALALDAVVSLSALALPPAYDFIKKKFLKPDADSPERTLGTLATTKPEILPAYTESMAKLKTAEVTWFNRDVIGKASQWVVDLRASIRPVTVVGSLSIFFIAGLWQIDLDPGIRIFCEVCVNSWMGSRLVKN